MEQSANVSYDIILISMTFIFIARMRCQLPFNPSKPCTFLVTNFCDNSTRSIQVVEWMECIRTACCDRFHRDIRSLVSGKSISRTTNHQTVGQHVTLIIEASVVQAGRHSLQLLSSASLGLSAGATQTLTCPRGSSAALIGWKIYHPLLRYPSFNSPLHSQQRSQPAHKFSYQFQRALRFSRFLLSRK